MLKTLMVSTVAMAMAVTVPLSAQQHEHGNDANDDQPGMMMQEMGMMAMHQMSQPQPMMLLHVADKLGLSAGQIEDLQALQEGVKSARQGHMQAAMEAHQRARTALEEGREDRQAYARAIEEAGSHMAMAHVAMTNAALDAKALLSDEQQSRLQMATKMGSMMQGQMRGMCAGMMGSSGMPQGMQDGGGGQHPHN